MKRFVTTLALVLALSGGAVAGRPDGGKAIAAALADPGRPTEDSSRDAARHPAELLGFADVKPGGRVLDFIIGGGYFTRILAKTVGPKGHVWAYTPAEFIKFRAQYGVDLKKVADAYSNVTPLSESIGALKLPGALDAIITVQNYHDMHISQFPADTAAKTNAALFKALKHGGTLLIVDHVAAAGSGVEAPDKLHRIDPQMLKDEVLAAGFRFDGELNILRNPADPHTALVFAPAIRGKTDQVVYRFRKP